MKVGYKLGEPGDGDPYRTTAYLDDEPLFDGSHVGTNKHTNLPVHLRWDSAHEVWHEVCVREFDQCGRYGDDTWAETGDRDFGCSCVGQIEGGSR